MLSILAFASLCLASGNLMSGQRSAAPDSLDKRQSQACVPVTLDPASSFCARSCGAGNIQCASFPNCFNPSAGEICCSDGSHCDASLGPDCCTGGATTLTIEVPGSTSTLSGSTSTEVSTSTAVSTSTSVSTSTITSTEVITVSTSTEITTTFDLTPTQPPTTSSSTSSIAGSSIPSYGNASTTATQPSAPSGSPSWYPPPQQTTNAAMRGEVVGWLLSGISALGLGLLL